MRLPRSRRVRALRHLPASAVEPGQADLIVALIAHELPELGHDKAFARTMIRLLVEGAHAQQISLILGDTDPPGSRGRLAGLVILVSLPIMLVSCVVLAFVGSFVAIGVVVAAWVAGGTLLAQLQEERWGCLPPRHVRLIRAFVLDRAHESAWAHYRAVRGIALDDEASLPWWLSGLQAVAHLPGLGAERRTSLRHDCTMLAALGNPPIQRAAEISAHGLSLPERSWRM